MYKRTILFCIALVNLQSIEASNRPNNNPCPSLCDGFALSGLYDIPNIPALTPQKIVSLLLRTGADVNEQNNEGRTPLHLACIDKTIIGRNHRIILPMLIYAGANVSIRDNDKHLPNDGSSFNLCFVFHQAMARKHNQKNSAIFNMACY